MKQEDKDTLFITFLIIALIAASAAFWEKHGRAMESCEKKYKTDFCWELLR